MGYPLIPAFFWLEKKKKKRKKARVVLVSHYYMSSNDEVVHIQLFDKEGNVLFDGLVCTDIAAEELCVMPPFQSADVLHLRGTKKQIDSFKGLKDIQVVCSMVTGWGSDDFEPFRDPIIFYISLEDGVVRKSTSIPSCPCSFLFVHKIAHDECQKAFQCDARLEELLFFAPGLRFVPDGIGKMKKLKKLSFSCARDLVSCSEELGELTQLRKLDFGGCHALESLPKSIGRLKNLQVLNLSGVGGLKKIAEEIGQLSSLTELSISCFMGHELPTSMGDLKQLQILKLEKVENIKMLPDELGNLLCLKQLVISHCNVEQLPSSLGRLTQLELLELHCLKNLKNLPQEFGCLTNLKELLLRWLTSVESLPKELSNLRALKSVTLLGLENLHLSPSDLSGWFKLNHLTLLYCPKLFSAPNWNNAMEYFCEHVIKRSVTLQTFQWSWDSKHKPLAEEALKQNGSILRSGCGRESGFSGMYDICVRNQSKHARAMNSVVSLLALRRWRNVLNHVQKEMVQMIAKMLWITKCDLHAW